jgi:exosortase A
MDNINIKSDELPEDDRQAQEYKQPQEHKQQWMWAFTGLVALSFILIIFFFGTVSEMVDIWWNIPTFNHCLLIIPMTAYICYERRIILKQILPSPSIWGAALVFLAALLWLIGDLGGVNVIRHFSVVLMLQGVILTILGMRVVRAFLFPFLYLLFLVPFGDFLVPILQDFTMDFIIVVLDILDIPVYVEGLFLTIPAGKFHVAEACAGLRFMVATLALGLLMSNLVYKTLGRQIIVVILSVLVPLIANGMRASGLVLIGHYIGMEHATGVDHLVYGWIFFAFVLIVFIGIAITFTNRKIDDSYIDMDNPYWFSALPSKLNQYLKFSVITIVFLGAAPLYSALISDRYSSIEQRDIAVSKIGNWQKSPIKSDWKPTFIGHSKEIIAQYSSAKNERVDLYVGYYLYQDSDHEIARWGNSFANEKWRRSASDQKDVTVNGMTYDTGINILHRRGKNRLVYFWYIVDGKIVSQTYMVKLLGMKAKLLGGQLEASVIAISVDVDGLLQDSAEQKLLNFMKNMPSLDKVILK